MFNKHSLFYKYFYMLFISVFIVLFLAIKSPEPTVNASDLIFDDPWCSTGSCWMYRYVDIYDGCYHPPGASYCTQQYIKNSWTYCGNDDSCDYDLSRKIKCYSDCSTEVVTQTGHCCLDASSCTPTSGCSCGNLSGSNQGFGSKSVSCSNGCGGTTSSTCYCTEACTVAQCSEGDYSSTPQGLGSFTYDTCTNTCGEPNSRTCYCNAATCTDIESDVEWYDTCPSGICRTDSAIIPISVIGPNCPSEQQRICHTTNSRPTLKDISIVPSGEIQAFLPYSTDNLFTRLVNKIVAVEFTDDKVMGYSSIDHSGTEEALNNPVGLQATYSDTDGQDDIQAIYIWWSPETNKDNFETPIKIDTNKTPETNYNDNWGFMITRDSIGGSWNKIYVPYISGTTAVWTNPKSLSDNNIYVKGSDGDNMIKISDISVNDSSNPNDIQINAVLTFLTGSGDDIVSTDKYNLWGMANDYVGFTEFEEDGNIKDHDIWQDSGTDWTLDMVKPTKPTITTSSSGNDDESKIRLVIATSDDEELSYVRVDACYGNITDPDTLKADDGSSYTMQLCDGMSTYFENVLDVRNTPDLISSSPTLVGSKTFSDDIEIGVGNNDDENGSITFYVTSMDTSGNYDQKFVIYKLGDWLAVTDGFVFGNTGVSSSTRVLENDWNTNSELKDSGYFEYNTVDLTDDVLLGGTSSNVAFLGTLEKYIENRSFKASNYSGAPVSAVYSELSMAYEVKKLNPAYKYIENTQATSLNTSLSSLCKAIDSSFDPEINFCIIKNSGDININNGFECDTRGLILSGNDVNINTDMLNESPTSDNACIVLARKDINISSGSNKSGAEVNYDIIQSFMIAGENVNIESDSSKNGLLVEGGLFGFGNENGTSILNGRSISWGYRNQYPVIAVDNNGKYGLLSKYLFGSQVEIFKLEIGFKPY